MPKSRPPYPPEFRREAVGMVRSGRLVKDVAVALGVTEQSLRNWVKQDQLDRRPRWLWFRTDRGRRCPFGSDLVQLRGSSEVPLVVCASFVT